MNRTRETAREVMVDAWGLYRKTVLEDPEAATRITLSSCLRFAWERHPARYADRIRKEWEQQGAANQLNSCTQTARDALFSWENRNAVRVASFHLEIDDLSSDTWIIMQERIDTLEYIQAVRNTRGQLPLPLRSIFHRAAVEALRRRIRDAQRNSFAPLDEAYHIGCAGEMEKRTELGAILNSIKNPTQRSVLGMMLQGWTVREISAATDRSKSAVQRIIDDIRAQLRPQLAA